MSRQIALGDPNILQQLLDSQQFGVPLNFTNAKTIDSGRAVQKAIKKQKDQYKLDNPPSNLPTEDPYQNELKQSKARGFGRGQSMLNRSTLASLPGANQTKRGPMSQLELSTVITGPSSVSQFDDKDEKYPLGVFKNYKMNCMYNTRLPIYDFKNAIINHVQSWDVTIISGSTGSGKTTQVPQYILDHWRENGMPVNIIVTQPRRIAATSVTQQVCRTREWDVGTICGYQIGLKAESSLDCRLLYVTTGVLLEKIIRARSLDQWSHIILDEVHERGIDMDLCLLLIRILKKTSPGIKIILMSASMEVERLQQYFADPDVTVGGMPTLTPPPSIIIDVPTYQVSLKYLPQVFQLLKSCNSAVSYRNWHSKDADLDEEGELCITETKRYLIRDLIASFDIIESQKRQKTYGAVLVFLPGIGDIKDVMDILNDDRFQRNRARHYNERDIVASEWSVIALHSCIPQENQNHIFNPCEKSYRKIILSTNIAESSLTIPDIVYIIDLCLTKQQIKDQSTGYGSLTLTWASKSNCTQRAGRAGRVAPGVCYRLVEQEFYDNLSEFELPEMQRSPLEKCVLKVKLLDENPIRFLESALDPPNDQDVAESVMLLKAVSALTSSENDSYLDGKLTFLGKVLANLPVDVRVGKLLVLGFVFGCLEDALTVAAGMQCSKSVFRAPFEHTDPVGTLRAFEKRLEFAANSNSDSIAIVNVYKKWQGRKHSKSFNSLADERKWCEVNFLDYKALSELEDMRSELMRRLSSFNMRPRPDYGRQHSAYRQQHSSVSHEVLSAFILKVAIAGAFYPQYFIRDATFYHESQSSKEFAGVDLYNSVLVGGVPMHDGKIYMRQLEKKFKDLCMSRIPGRPTVRCENTKAIIIFNKELSMHDPFSGDLSSSGGQHMPIHFGKIHPSVFLAVKARSIRKIGLFLKEVPENHESRRKLENAQESYRAQALAKYDQSGSFLTLGASTFVMLPSVEENFVYIKPTFIISVTHFRGILKRSVQEDELEQRLAAAISDAVENDELVPVRVPKPGPLYLAVYTDKTYGSNYYRCKFIYREENSVSCLVNFVDYGNSERVSLKNMFELPESVKKLKIPQLAVDFILADIKPKESNHPDGKWFKEESKLVEKLVASSLFMLEDAPDYSNQCLSIKIYSVVNAMIHGYVLLRENAEVTLQSLLMDGVSNSQLAGLEASVDVKFNVRERMLLQEGIGQWCQERYDSRQDHLIRESFRPAAATMGSESSTAGFSSSKMISQAMDDQCVDELGDTINLFREERDWKYINLQGPSHPYEMRFSGLSNKMKARSCRVAGTSVNSVAIDPEPQEPLDRLLVAGCVGIDGKDSTKTILGHTTLFPHIPGLPVLLSLLFAPIAEPRCNIPYKTHYTSFLCGMGSVLSSNYDPLADAPSFQPVFSQLDMLVNADVALDNADIDMINKIRLHINNILNFKDQVEIDDMAMFDKQRILREKIFEIFFQKKYNLIPCDPDCRSQDYLSWGWPITQGADTQVHSSHSLMDILSSPIYALHKSFADINSDYNGLVSVILNERACQGIDRPYNVKEMQWSMRWRDFARVYIKSLYSVVNSKSGDNDLFVCPICPCTETKRIGVPVNGRAELVSHLKSPQHRAREDILPLNYKPLMPF